MRAIFTSAAVLSLVLSSGCASGQKLSPEEAREWVTANDAALMKVVSTLRKCDGSTNNKFNRIFRDRASFTGHCDDRTQEIIEYLDDLNLTAVAYQPMPDEQPLGWVEFDLYSSGIVTSGTSVSVIWHAAPGECAVEETIEDGFEFSERPLFDGDCEWLYRYMSN